MTKHGRNCTNSSVYTYHERKKDAQASGFGTDRMRASKDSVKDFDCCCLTLQPCRNPVITPDGYLYDKEAIIEYILTKKKEFRSKMKQYEKEKKKEELELKELAMAEMRTKQSRFERQESSIISKEAKPGGSTGSLSTSSSIEHADRDRHLPSFWIPSLTPSASASRLHPPNPHVLCPMSGRRLRVNQLQPVLFSAAAADTSEEQLAVVARATRYKCCVTGDVLGNTVPCAVLKPTGHVVTVDCLNRLIRKDMLHPITGQKLTDSDIITIQSGGTGFAVTNNQLSLSGARPVMQA